MPPLRGNYLVGYLNGSIPQPPEWLTTKKKDADGKEKEERILNPAHF
jgi:hypothetical protein